MSHNFELFLGCLGNGTTVCNKAVIEHGDYKKIAHISEHGVIKLYVSESYIPDDAMQKIKNVAANEKEKFMKMWNKKDLLQKHTFMMEIPTIGCGYSAMQLVDSENNNLPISERVPLMEKVFFETHM